jgi:hypothetical protein
VRTSQNLQTFSKFSAINFLSPYLSTQKNYPPMPRSIFGRLAALTLIFIGLCALKPMPLSKPYRFEPTNHQSPINQSPLHQSPDWGFFAHKRINRLAVLTLPPQMMVFFKPNIDYLTDHAVDPDMRRYASKHEAPGITLIWITTVLRHSTNCHGNGWMRSWHTPIFGP